MPPPEPRSLPPASDPPDPSPAELTAFVKRRAVELGFELVGVTGPEPPDHLEVYGEWLAQGRHGEMGYLAAPRAIERRRDPRTILPECRSILVVGANYLPSAAPTRHVAAYALGQDYHDILPARLDELVKSVQDHLGRQISHRIYSDTGPILERELAQRAGLGWIGKNTCLIHPEHGSYFLLAEVLLDLELVPDAPVSSDHCGNCTRCLEACPTQCIRPDRTLQADRCISYLTIELKGAMPLDLRQPVGDWVFGCDICQQVCPWNQRFARPTSDPAFQPRPWLLQAGLDGILRLEADGYRRELQGSPLKRPHLAGLLRNAVVVAGNQGDPSRLPALRRLLMEAPEHLVRAHAAWALGQIGDSAAEAALREGAESEVDAEVREEIRRALGEAG
jgi:epoxyqueuosine reductase